MRRLRDVFYVNAFLEKNEFVYYGMEFREFCKFVPNRINNILLLKSEYFGGRYSRSCNMVMVENEEVEELLQENIYDYGDFCWVDYADADSVEHLQPQKIAELLYLGQPVL